MWLIHSPPAPYPYWLLWYLFIYPPLPNLSCLTISKLLKSLIHYITCYTTYSFALLPVLLVMPPVGLPSPNTTIWVDWANVKNLILYLLLVTIVVVKDIDLSIHSSPACQLLPVSRAIQSWKTLKNLAHFTVSCKWHRWEGLIYYHFTLPYNTIYLCWDCR